MLYMYFGSQTIATGALPVLVAYNHFSSVPNKHLLGIILFCRWWGFASAPQVNIPLQLFWKEFGNTQEEADASWIRHLSDVLFSDISTQTAYTSTRKDIISKLTDASIGTTITNLDPRNPVSVNIYGDSGPLGWVIGGMEYSIQQQEHHQELR
ncbi:MAG: hypothetical protein LBC02_13945 [Planctomycetaceae bacterium]|jgi:hypothetical protein|nr:hypothetical protein [Planctomycetaceae bacterium]